jgi:iron complex outermembrane recepter protein
MTGRKLIFYITAVCLFLLLGQALLFSQVTITGKVTDVEGLPQAKVVVSIPEYSLRTYTDDQGQFSFQLPKNAAGQVSVVFNSPTCYPQTTNVQLRPSGTTLEVALTPRKIEQQSIDVIASRYDVPLATNPAATSIVVPQTLAQMPRGVAPEEALQSVPSVKADNQANGERVHVSIRGQGILSEHGIRGIEVLLDGIPLSDPSGFVPDLFDVDWNGIQEVQVMRGPVAVLYGGGSSGGVIDLRTRQPQETTNGSFWATGGSNGFYKARGELSGTWKGAGYDFALSRTAGDGYRQHTWFWGDILSGRVYLKPTSSLRLNFFGIGTGYFNQNAEGLNLVWLAENRRQANPDAITYNEYQKTTRFSGGVSGDWTASDNQHLAFTLFSRPTGYLESVPSSVQHRTITPVEGSTQYTWDYHGGSINNSLSVGVDLGGQWVDAWAYPNMGNAVQGPNLVASGNILQSNVATYGMDRVNFGPKWTLFMSGRWDRITNSYTDNLKLNGLDLSGSRVFEQPTGRVGVSWSPRDNFTGFLSWGSGFLPPATEELYANPAHIGGFNTQLQPATSQGPDIGIRGTAGFHLYYDVTVFYLQTHNDFERYRIVGRPLETFYANGGDSSRYGVEVEARWLPTRWLTISGAYTYSHFTYYDYWSKTYPGDLSGHYLPNIPANMFYNDAVVQLPKGFQVSYQLLAMSRAYIDPTNATWIDGYPLLGAKLSKNWQYKKYWGSVFITGRNLTDTQYIAFTEPDPDGNSYQPGPGRELFGGLEFHF